MSEPLAVALQDGLFAEDQDGHYRLLANHCPVCELTFFPVRSYCAKCASSALDTLNLSLRGTVHSFSMIDRKSKFSIIEPPYMQVEVRMPEQVHVFSVLDQCNFEDVAIGQTVEMYVGKVSQNAEGSDVVTYKFKPANDQGAEQ